MEEHSGIQFTEDEMYAITKAYYEEYIKPSLDKHAKALKDELNNSKFSKRPILCNGIEVGNVIKSKGGNCPYVYAEQSKAAFDFMFEHGLIDGSKIANCFKAKWGDKFARAGKYVIYQETGEPCDFLGWEEQTVGNINIRGCSFDDVDVAMQPKLQGLSIKQLVSGD